MLAVKGIYDNGKVVFEGENPVQTEKSEVIVIFPDNGEKMHESGLSIEKKKKLFEEFSGKIDRVIDLKAEKMEALEIKYESAD